MMGIIRITTECIWTMCTDALGCILYLVILRNKISKQKYTVIVPVIMILELCFLIMTQGIPDYWWLPSSIAVLCRIYIFICAVDGKNKVLKGLCVIRGFLLAELAAFIEWQTYTYLSGYLNTHRLFCMLVLLVMLLFYASTAGIELWKYPEERKWKNRILEFMPVVGIALAVFLMIHLYVLISQEDIILNAQLSPYRIGIDFAGLFLFYICSMIYYEQKAKKEVEAMETVIRKQYQQYQMAQNDRDTINRKYHDFKHQLTVLQNLNHTEERNQYLDHLKEDLENYEAFYDTGCPVLDTILTENHLKCLEEKIKITCVADGSLLNFMDIMDICSVFGNILDNAIEYEKTLDERKRMIHLSVSRQKGFVLIEAENFYEGKEFEGNLPKTTKEDKSMHGFGLKSIQKSAVKYNGKMTVSVHNNWFEVRILIPLNF